MELYRLVNKKFPIELSGIGASITGARWNSKGIEVIYAAQSRALAMAEVAVHLTLSTLPKGFVMLSIHVPDDITIEIVAVENLEKGWNSFPERVTTQKIGDIFLKSKENCVLKVPSAVVKGDFNFLINPYHKDFEKIAIIQQDDFPFDHRIFK